MAAYDLVGGVAADGRCARISVFTLADVDSCSTIDVPEIFRSAIQRTSSSDTT
jgi:hypothetical protein